MNLKLSFFSFPSFFLVSQADDKMAKGFLEKKICRKYIKMLKTRKPGFKEKREKQTQHKNL